MLVLAALAALSLAYVWGGAGRMMNMQTKSASQAEFAAVEPQQETRIVIEAASVRAGHIRGTLLEKQDEQHYRRTASAAEITFTSATKIVMGKAEDVRAGTILHITGKVAQDRSVAAEQIVILTGYVQVR